MGRLILALAAVLLVLGLMGAAYLGMFPPEPRPQTIETPIGQDRLQGR